MYLFGKSCQISSDHHQLFQPGVCKSWPASDRLCPDRRKIGGGGKVLSDCHRGVKVYHHMPPPTRHHNRLARMLNTLNRCKPSWPVRVPGPRVDGLVPADCLLTLSTKHQLGRCVWWEEAPALVTRDEGIPSRGAQWVYVDSRARPLKAIEAPLS